MILHTFLGLLLLLIPAGALYVLERKMLQPFAVAVARMMVQVLVLCLMVWVLIKVDSLWLLLVWLLAMSGFSAVLVLKRCNLDVRKLLIAVASGLYVGVFLIGLWLLGLVLPVSVFDVRWFVPVMALLTGHATVMMIRGLNTYVSALRTDEQQYDYVVKEIKKKLEEGYNYEDIAILVRKRKSIPKYVDLLTKDHEPYTFTVDHLEDGEGIPIESAPHATMTLRMKLPFFCEPLSLLRKMK